MSPGLEESRITCPYCWEQIWIQLDLSVAGQEYIEDCQVCCRPIEIRYSVADDALEGVTATRADG